MFHRAAQVLSLCLFLAGPAVAVESFRITGQGQAPAPLIISAQASDATKAVAKELAGYLGQTSGAKIEVQTGDGAHGIVLGTLAEFPYPEMKDGLALRGEYDGREAFAIRSEKERLLLIGATDLGASHAAFTLLDQLGCRWFFPAKEWEVVPSRPEISVGLEITDRPRILARRIWYGYGAFYDKGHPRGGSVMLDYEAWTRHNRMAGSFNVYAGHAWQAVIAANKKLFDEHPEYRALVKGKRQGDQLCVSNPAVRRLATEWALAYLEKNPDKEMVSMECSDGNDQCECDQCAKLGSVSNRAFGLANEVAKEVNRRFPGKMVGSLAYNEHSEPPAFDLEPNVYVQLTGGSILGPYSHDELVELWPKKCKKLGFYEYFSVWLWDFDKLPGGGGGNITRIKAGIDRYIKAGATSYDAESGNNWGVHGRAYYVTNKLLWNPGINMDAQLDDFYDKAFGPGAPAMKRYYERVAPDNEPLISRGLVGEAFRDVEEAARLASGRPDAQARLDTLKHYLRYEHLRWLHDHEKDNARQKADAVAALTLAYRTRYEYMNHWAAMRSSWASQLAKQFNEPGWLPGDPSPKPWMVETPVTHDETEAWFHEGLDFFQPTPVTELKFSNNLVLGGQPNGGSKPPSLGLSFQRPMTYALHSLNGEPLEAVFTTGVIAWYRDHAPVTWKLRDGAGATIAEGTLPQDGELHPLSMKVPHAGTYFFEGNDSGAGWKFAVDGSNAAVLMNQRGRRVVNLGQMPEMFFYVPKGTRSLQYFWSGSAHKVLGPDHKVIAEVKVNDEVVAVPVPAGMDGKCWSLSPQVHDQLWFFNVPNCLAASPEALLLPREVVARDEPGKNVE